MNKREREHNLIYVLFLYLDPYKIKICYLAEFHFTLSAEKSRLSLPKKCIRLGFMSFGWRYPIAIKLSKANTPRTRFCANL